MPATASALTGDDLTDIRGLLAEAARDLNDSVTRTQGATVAAVRQARSYARYMTALAARIHRACPAPAETGEAARLVAASGTACTRARGYLGRGDIDLIYRLLMAGSARHEELAATAGYELAISARGAAARRRALACLLADGFPASTPESWAATLQLPAAREVPGP
jgi:hypothetical protein